MSEQAYQVSLPVYEGPLDVLLRLIERQELDITLVSLASVAEQFLDYVAQMESCDAAHLADFLVVAGKLLLIKSRALLPKPAPLGVPEEEEPGIDLVQQLIEYRRFKQAAGWLRDLQALGQQSYVRLVGTPDVPRRPDLSGITLNLLLTTVREILEVTPPAPSVNGTIAPLTVTVTQQIERLEAQLVRHGALGLTQFLANAASRLEIVVTLLAVLELVKRGQALVHQEIPFGEILVTTAARADA